jgi:ribose/xylose/arabinose/galactoside ABC-type transport system permease subunit
MSAAPVAVPAAHERNGSRVAWEDLMLYVAFVVICAVFAVIAPHFLSWANIQIIGIEAAAVGIVACGATFVIVAADIDLSVGSMYALAGTLAAYLMEHNWGWGFAVAAVAIVALVVGVLNGLLTVKGRIPAFLVTLGMLGVVRGVDQMLTGTSAVPIYNPSFNNFFAGPLLGMNRPIVWAVVVAVVAGIILAKTAYGRYVYAVGGDAETSRLAGIPVSRIRLTNFVASSLLAAFAGLIVAGRIQTGQPTIGVNLELDVITAVILGGTNLFGGKGHIFGTIVGALLITIIGNGLLLLGADDNVQTVCKGAILIVTVLARRLADRSGSNGR